MKLVTLEIATLLFITEIQRARVQSVVRYMLNEYAELSSGRECL